MPPNKEQRERLKDWLDLGKKLRDHGPDFVKRPLDHRAALEGYREGRLEVHFHVGIRSGLLAVNPKHFCARLKAKGVRPLAVEGTDFHARGQEMPCRALLDLKSTAVLGEDRLDLSVLVPPHQLVEHEKGVQPHDGSP